MERLPYVASPDPAQGRKRRSAAALRLARNMAKSSIAVSVRRAARLCVSGMVPPSTPKLAGGAARPPSATSAPTTTRASAASVGSERMDARTPKAGQRPVARKGPDRTPAIFIVWRKRTEREDSPPHALCVCAELSPVAIRAPQQFRPVFSLLGCQTWLREQSTGEFRGGGRWSAPGQRGVFHSV